MARKTECYVDTSALIAFLDRSDSYHSLFKRLFFADQKLTLADAHGLALMTKRRISHCWSTDRHLKLAGAALVI